MTGLDPDQGRDQAKAAARRQALARRRRAFDAGHANAAGELVAALQPFRGRCLAGYMPMRTEIDPLPAMAAMAAFGPVCVPVIVAPAAPLRFARWTPGCAMVEGEFGARIPLAPEWLRPGVVIVPLVAFDRSGGRLGYGGGFYDRTLEVLRRQGPVMALGFAWAAQEADDLPQESTDQPLDLIVTETGAIRPGPRP